MRFKHEKVGSSIEPVEEHPAYTPLQLRRQQFLNDMRQNKGRENETLANLASFQTKLKKGTESAWMRQQVNFAVDSEKAFNFDKTR